MKFLYSDYGLLAIGGLYIYHVCLKPDWPVLNQYIVRTLIYPVPLTALRYLFCSICDQISTTKSSWRIVNTVRRKEIMVPFPVIQASSTLKVIPVLLRACVIFSTWPRTPCAKIPRHELTSSHFGGNYFAHRALGIWSIDFARTAQKQKAQSSEALFYASLEVQKWSIDTYLFHQILGLRQLGIKWIIYRNKLCVDLITTCQIRFSRSSLGKLSVIFLIKVKITKHRILICVIWLNLDWLWI